LFFSSSKKRKKEMEKTIRLFDALLEDMGYCVENGKLLLGKKKKSAPKKAQVRVKTSCAKTPPQVRTKGSNCFNAYA